MAQQEASTITIKRIEFKTPRKYNVFFHNDDFTTFEFVEEVLEQIFHKTPDEAVQLAIDVHRLGKKVVGIYSYDVAKTKANLTMERARAEGFPLMVTYEPVE